MKKLYFLTIFLFGASYSVYTQVNLHHKTLFQFKYHHSYYYLDSKKTNLSTTLKIKQLIPLAYQYKQLAFFCKVEVKIEQKLNTPIKFRLGSVNYTDYLEYKSRFKNYPSD